MQNDSKSMPCELGGLSQGLGQHMFRRTVPNRTAGEVAARRQHEGVRSKASSPSDALPASVFRRCVSLIQHSEATPVGAPPSGSQFPSTIYPASEPRASAFQRFDIPGQDRPSPSQSRAPVSSQADINTMLSIPTNLPTHSPIPIPVFHRASIPLVVPLDVSKPSSQGIPDKPSAVPAPSAPPSFRREPPASVPAPSTPLSFRREPLASVPAPSVPPSFQREVPTSISSPGSGAACFRREPPASTSSAPGVCPPSFQRQPPASVSTPEIDGPSFRPEPPASVSTPGISAPSFQRDPPASVSASQIGALSFQRDPPASVSASQIGALSFQRDPPASVSASQIGAASQRDPPASIIPCFRRTPPTSTTPIPNVQDAQPPLDVQLQPPNGERIPSPADTPYARAGSKRRRRDFVTSLEMAVKENEKAKDEAPVVHDPPKPTPDEMVRVHQQLLKISASEYSTYAAMACYVAALTKNRYEVEKASVNAVHEARDGFARVESKIQSWL